MQLTGKELWSLRIIENGYAYKIDDGVVPSNGLDDALYTFIAEHDFGVVHIDPFQSITFKTMETVSMPLICCGALTLKSTYSRQGLILVTNSPVDPGYRGKLTMRLFNSDALTPIKLWGLGGIMQMTVNFLTETTEGYHGRHQGS